MSKADKAWWKWTVSSYVDRICHLHIFLYFFLFKYALKYVLWEKELVPEVSRTTVFSFFFDQPTLSGSFSLTRSDDLEITLDSSRCKDTRNEKERERVLSDTVQCCREDQSGVIRSKRSGSTLPCLSHLLVQDQSSFGLQIIRNVFKKRDKGGEKRPKAFVGAYLNVSIQFC